MQGGTVTLATVTDGTTNTVMFSEWVRGRADTTSTQGLWQIFIAPIAHPATASYVVPSTYSTSCQSSTSLAGTGYNLKGCFWYNDKCGQGGGYSHIDTPNLKACMYGNDTDAFAGRTIVGASSNHSGGVNVGMIDGSVRFVKNSVSNLTWWALATRGGGEIISADSL